jgi:hypothetical protein
MLPKYNFLNILSILKQNLQLSKSLKPFKNAKYGIGKIEPIPGIAITI